MSEFDELYNKHFKEKDEDVCVECFKHNRVARILMLISFTMVVICLGYIFHRQIEIENDIWDLKYGDEMLVELQTTGQIIYRGVQGSGSMRPLIDKRIYPSLKTTNKDVTIETGEMIDEYDLRKIYVYKKINETNHTSLIMHRLVGVYNITNKTVYVFMGDNNDVVDEPVYREQIIEEIIGVKFT